jgi:hypothetical protein
MLCVIDKILREKPQQNKGAFVWREGLIGLLSRGLKILNFIERDTSRGHTKTLKTRKRGCKLFCNPLKYGGE